MQKQLILGLLLVSLGSQCQSFPMPSHACQDAARTENIIKCLSYTGQFQDTLNGGDLCEQAKLVYSCYNRTCCFENKAYDIARDPSLESCNIDCLHTTPPPTTLPPSEIYTTTMAPFTTPSPASISPQIILNPFHHKETDKDRLGSHIHAILIFSIFPVSIMILFPLSQSFFASSSTPVHVWNRRIQGPPLSVHRTRMGVI